MNRNALAFVLLLSSGATGGGGVVPSSERSRCKPRPPLSVKRREFRPGGIPS